MPFKRPLAQYGNPRGLVTSFGHFNISRGVAEAVFAEHGDQILDYISQFRDVDQDPLSSWEFSSEDKYLSAAVAGFYLESLMEEYDSVVPEDPAVPVTPLEFALLRYRSKPASVKTFVTTGRDVNGVMEDDLETWRSWGFS